MEGFACRSLLSSMATVQWARSSSRISIWPATHVLWISRSTHVILRKTSSKNDTMRPACPCHSCLTVAHNAQPHLLNSSSSIGKRSNLAFSSSKSVCFALVCAREFGSLCRIRSLARSTSSRCCSPTDIR